MGKITDVLSVKGRAVQRISAEARVSDAVEAMCRHRVGSLLVGDSAEPLGIFTERDLMQRVLVEHRDPWDTKVVDVMTRKLLCIDLETPVGQAMAIMTESRCRHLPVVDGGKVVGLVSIGDLVRWASREQEFELRWLNDYVCGRYPG